MIESYEWITDNESLQLAADIWRSSDAIAIDTEFVRTDSFFAHLGLIQICLDDRIWLIDPLKISQWQPLAEVLSDASVVKVLHALSEDAEVLEHYLGVALTNVFDSQIAAAFLGYGVQMSYAKLVESLFEVSLPKEATRSDWLKRPLEKEQCAYAAADVHWLYQVYLDFSARLKTQSRYEWVKEDSQRMVFNNIPIPADKYYLKLRGAWKLKSNRLCALRDLCQWRESLARSSNVNRGRILHDKDLIVLAEKMPTSKSHLNKVLKIPSRKIRLYGDQIIHMIREAQEAKRDDWPDRIFGPLPADQADLLKDIRSLVATKASQIDVPSELLARRKELEAWLRTGAISGSYQAPESMSGWRGPYLLDLIGNYLNAYWEDVNEA